MFKSAKPSTIEIERLILSYLYMAYSRFSDIFRIGFEVAKTNFRLRVEGSYLGILWYLLNPLILFAIFMLIKRAAFSEVDIPYYPLYLLIGIAGFNFFKIIISEAINSIANNPDYIKSINRAAPESLVLAVVIQAIFSHIFEFILIIALALYLNVSLIGLLLYPFVLILFAILSLGLAFIAATVGVYVGDLDNVWIILSQLLLLGTPIFYIINPGSLIYTLNLFNPLFYFLEVVRSLIIEGRILDIKLFLIFIAISIISIFLGLIIFRSYKNKFAELL